MNNTTHTSRLFRAKRENDGEWVFGSLILTESAAYIYCPETHRRYKVNPETVGQDTGFVDSKEQPLFEGDIVDLLTFHAVGKTEIDYSKIVGYNAEAVGFSFYDPDNHYDPASVGEEWEAIGAYNSRELVLVGNIHDNPDFFLEDEETDLEREINALYDKGDDLYDEQREMRYARKE